MSYSGAGYEAEDSRLSPPVPTGHGRAILETYRKDIVSGFEKDAPRHNPMNPDRPQSSVMVDLKDPIQVHLLTETALTDSKEYEVLSQEEVDGLKKQMQYLNQRIDSTRTNLNIQSKYRDAAISMTRLYSPTRSDSKRRSLLGNRLSGDQAREAEVERQACEKKCEELAAELFSLEKRLMEPHRRLLEHTAGILQLTHKVSKRKNTGQNGPIINGIPGSPESLYTYARNSVDHDNYLDDTGMFQIDGLDRKPIEIPQKSPIREQTSQMKEEMERMREENKLLVQSLADTEQRLNNLNGALHQTIVKFNPHANRDYDEPPRIIGAEVSSDTLAPHLEYLDRGLMAVQAEQGAKPVSGGGETGARIEQLNLQLRDLLMITNPYYDPKPIPAEADLEGQLMYLEDSIGNVDSELSKAAKKGGADDPNTVLEGLWNTTQTGFANIKLQKEERRRARAERGLEEEEDVSDDDAVDTNEAYSLAGFSKRVEYLYRQATILKDQKSVLKRQIKQQRELNNKSDAEKDEELSKKQDELEQSREQLARAEKDARDAQEMLAEAASDLERAREMAGSASAAEADNKERDAKLRETQKSLAAAESESKAAAVRLAEVDHTIEDLQSQLRAASQAKSAAEKATESLRQELEEKGTDLQARETALKEKSTEMEELNVMIAELKTELTIAQAELDGAYGTRAERAADVAAIKSSGEVAKLTSQVERLKTELGATVKELEDITKETISSEKEKLELEGKLDDALTLKAALEGEIDTLKEKTEAEAQKLRDTVAKLEEELDGEKLKGGTSTPGGRGAAASMLSEQFRSTMRGERKKFQEDLREERNKVRRLEEELGRMKRAAGPGKSPLSPR